MDRTQSVGTTSRVERQLAHLKIISRLLGHELHTQTSPRLTLSREEVLEIQTSIDLYIEEVLKTKGQGRSNALDVNARELEVQALPARVN